MSQQFDPDAYLASKEAFDPDAYLQKKTGEAPTVQEMHPSFTAADRLVVKNFSKDNEAAVNYLQKRHGDLEISVDDYSGQIKARAKDGSDGGSYRVLDPDTGFFSKDILQDAGDIAYDALAGVGTTLASGVAGVAGSGAGGVGAIPAAMAAGGAAGAGFEGLRQKLGKELGIEQEVDPLDVGVAGVAGSVSPLLFGTGAGAGQIAKGAVKKGLEESAVASAQRGLLSRGLGFAKDKILPKVGEKMSGVDAQTLRTLGGQYGDLLAMEADPSATRNLAKEAAKSTGQTLRTAKNKAWGEVTDALDKYGDVEVDITPVTTKLQQAIAEADDLAQSTGNEASQSLVTRLKGEFQKHFTRKVQVDDGAGNLIDAAAPIETLPVKAAAQLDRQLGELADLGKLKAGDVRGGVGNRFTPAASFEDKTVGQIAADAKKTMSNIIDETLPPNASAARQRYGDIANLEKEVGAVLGKNPKKIFKSLANLSKNRTDQELLNQLDTQYGTDLIAQAKKADLFHTFANPSLLPISTKGTVSTGRAIPAAAAGGAAGYYLGSQAGGEGHGSGVLGAGVGGLVGATLGGPAAMRQYVKFGLKGSKGLKKVPLAVRNAAALKLITEPQVRSAWEGME